MATLYYVIYPASMGEPSGTQVSTGRNATGGTATASGSETARATTGQQVFGAPATGLTDNTSYRVAFVWSDGNSFSNVAVSPPWRTGALFRASATGSGALTARLTVAAGGSLLQAELTGVATVTGSLLTGIRLSAELVSVATVAAVTRPPQAIAAYLWAESSLTGRFAQILMPGRGVIVPPDPMRVVVGIWNEEQS